MRLAVFVAIALSGCAAALVPRETSAPDATAPRIRMPGPGAARGLVAARSNAACEACHVEEARAWRGSLHQRAHLEPTYQRALAIEPLPFCRSCHAPEADPSSDPPAELGELGVSCVTCHVTDGPVLAAPRPGVRAERAPHAIVRDARFASGEACASCHEFPFPGKRGRNASELMQSTAREHGASNEASTPCAGCHMPQVAGRRDHRFLGSRDEAFVRSAARISAERLDARRVAITLVPEAPGHAFPTGDLFRRIEISAEAAGPDDMVLGSATKILARHWDLRPGQASRTLSHDDRLGREPVVVTLDVGEAGEGRDLVWRVAYQRVAHLTGADATSAEIDGEIVLDEGRLGP